MGHKAGDTCIKNACTKICRVFSHSPVFRVGGDEFVVLLTGTDYSQRKELMEEINAVPKDLSKIRIGETIAAGMAEYKKSRHESLQSVLEEADRAMYEKKQLLKESLVPVDKGGDTFLLYCLHQDDYEQLMREFLSDLFDEKEIADFIHIRVGIFVDARQTADVEERFNRAKIAADQVKDDQKKICGFYDQICAAPIRH